MTNDLQILVASRSWCATPADYNTINGLVFEADGSGRLLLGRCQTVYAVVAYRFEVLPDGILSLKYTSAETNEHFLARGEAGTQIVDADGNPRQLKYVLTPGTFSGE